MSWLKYAENTDNGIYHCSFLNEKKVFIIVPHEDDELITLGCVLPIFQKNNAEIYLLYATNGDYHGKELGNIRLEEAKRYCEVIGLKEENIFFMGFGDWGEQNPHLYNISSEAISPSGCSHTYGPNTYNKTKVLKQSRENYKRILKEYVNKVYADYIFCIDCDMHGDHIALSLIFEQVIEELIKEQNYQPKVFKMFSHDMAWMGIEDFYDINIQSTKPIEDNPRHTYAVSFQDAYYPWAERVRFPINKDYLSYSSFNNKFKKTMECYKSQYVKYHFPRLLNGDQVFWERRTDNLVIKSTVSSTSGDVSCFNKFQMFESDNIASKDMLLESSKMVWRPALDDDEKLVNIEFEKGEILQEIVLYSSFNKNDKIFKVQIEIDDNATLFVDDILQYGKPTRIYLNENHVCKNVRLRIVSSTNGAGLSKVEIFPKKCEQIHFVKIMLDDNFIYSYSLKGEECVDSFELYVYGTSGSELRDFYDQDFEWYLIQDQNKQKISSVINFKLNCMRDYKIRVEYSKDRNIYDEVVIKKHSIMFVKGMRVLGLLELYFNKIVYKLRRILKV